MSIKGPLSGVRIVDLSQAHAGPCASQILGDLGAEVIKIEPPIGDSIRVSFLPGDGYYALALNRNKKSVEPVAQTCW